MRKGAAGFSLFELIMVIVIVGILAGLAVPRLSDVQTTTQARGYVDGLLSSIRYAQKLAISSECDTRVVASNNGYEIRQWVVCTPTSHLSTADTLIQHPATAAPMQATPTNGIAITGLFDFYFDKKGQPKQVNNNSVISTPSVMTIADHTVTVEAFTGFAHAP